MGTVIDGRRKAVIMPQFALWRSLDIATTNLRVGETILLSLLVLGSRSGAGKAVLHKVIKSLLLAWIEAGFAVEAAVASGL